MDDIVIIDNFLAEKEFVTLRDVVSGEYFPWFFSKAHTTHPYEENNISPGQFIHMIYTNLVPTSPHYDSHFHPILKALNVSVLTRVKLNLNPRLSEPFYSEFHIDALKYPEDIVHQFSTSIFYMNTNNGYTELKDGTKVESVANRLVTFPANIEHRGVTQTDEQRRIVINFNYLKNPNKK